MSYWLGLDVSVIANWIIFYLYDEQEQNMNLDEVHFVFLNEISESIDHMQNVFISYKICDDSFFKGQSVKLV